MNKPNTFDIIQDLSKKREFFSVRENYYNVNPALVRGGVKNYRAGPRSDDSLGRGAHTRDYLPARLRHTLTDKHSLVVVVVADPQRMVREAPGHVFVVCGRH